MTGWNVQAQFSVEGRPEPRQGEELVVLYQYITPGYFSAIGVPTLAGRGFTAADRDSLNPVGVINQSLARAEFSGSDPIGRRIKFGSQASEERWITIVGVIPDFRHYRLPEPMRAAIYLPFYEAVGYTQTVAIRSEADPAVLLPAAAAVVRSLDADLPLFQVQTLDEVVSRSLWRQRLQGQVLGTFAVLAMLLAITGMYGVISYAVAQRTRELGVRMALGASRRQVIVLVVGQGARLALLGVALGLAGALALTRVLSALLYGVKATDALTFALVPLLLGAVAVAACWLPARRASQIDPLVAMRAE
jgi:predicted permease